MSNISKNLVLIIKNLQNGKKNEKEKRCQKYKDYREINKEIIPIRRKNYKGRGKKRKEEAKRLQKQEFVNDLQKKKEQRRIILRLRNKDKKNIYDEDLIKEREIELETNLLLDLNSLDLIEDDILLENQNENELDVYNYEETYTNGLSETYNYISDAIYEFSDDNYIDSFENKLNENKILSNFQLYSGDMIYNRPKILKEQEKMNLKTTTIYEIRLLEKERRRLQRETIKNLTKKGRTEIINKRYKENQQKLKDIRKLEEKIRLEEEEERLNEITRILIKKEEERKEEERKKVNQNFLTLIAYLNSLNLNEMIIMTKIENFDPYSWTFFKKDDYFVFIRPNLLDKYYLFVPEKKVFMELTSDKYNKIKNKLYYLSSSDSKIIDKKFDEYFIRKNN